MPDSLAFAEIIVTQCTCVALENFPMCFYIHVGLRAGRAGLLASGFRMGPGEVSGCLSVRWP